MAYRLAKPDICIYLQWPAELLMHNIKKRGREFENSITIDYLNRVEENYRNYLKDQQRFPAVEINRCSNGMMENRVFFEKIVEILKQIPTLSGYSTIKL